MKRILLLGGVTEALAIARTLGPEHIYSLAGVGRVPADLTCQVRVGGYGGAEGLAQFVRDEGISLILDATHPYAAQISRNAAEAAQLSGVPCWALRRPAWQPQAGDDWREVSDWAELIEALKPFKRPLFTLGREPLQHLDEIPAGQFWTLRALEAGNGGKSDADRQFEVYDIVFQEAVSGLSKGGTVEFNGIKIGDVVTARVEVMELVAELVITATGARIFSTLIRI